jgi:hypothetical protein
MKYDLSSQKENLDNLRCFNVPAQSRYYNFDGYFVSSRQEEEIDAYSYVQLFRNGSFEALWTYPLLAHITERKIPIHFVENTLLEKVRFYLHFQKYYLGVEPPIFIMLTLMGVGGYTLSVGSLGQGGVNYNNPIDRGTLIIQENMVERFEDDVNNVMKPIFDSIWNAAGWPGSLFYDSKGNRTP